jgi:hypothetical protein
MEFDFMEFLFVVRAVRGRLPAGAAIDARERRSLVGVAVPAAPASGASSRRTAHSRLP